MKAKKIQKWQENKILKRLKKGDQESFGKIYDVYVDKIYKYVFLKVGSREKSEEIVQDIFLKFWRFAREEENEVKGISAFLYSISRSMVADYYRAENKERNDVSFDEALAREDELEAVDSLSDEVDINIDLERVMGLLAQLPQLYQDVIIMKYMEELDNKEIAAVLDKEEGNVRVLTHRAIKQLRKILLENNG